MALTCSRMSVVSLRMTVSSTMWSVPSRGLSASRVGHCSRASPASRTPLGRQGSGRGGPAEAVLPWEAIQWTFRILGVKLGQVLRQIEH